MLECELCSHTFAWSLAKGLKFTGTRMQSFHLGDSARADDRSAWQRFFARLEGCAALETPWTLVLQDPLANSFVSSVVDDPRSDPRMSIEARTLLVMLPSKCRHAASCTMLYL